MIFGKRERMFRKKDGKREKKGRMERMNEMNDYSLGCMGRVAKERASSSSVGMVSVMVPSLKR